MNKKNRFSMLEVSPEDKTSKHSSSEKIAQENPEVPKKLVKEMKTIIPNNEFEENLKKHNLKEQIKDIHVKKQVIESKILQIKRMAWIKIAIGIYIVVLVSKKYIWSDSRIKALGNGEGELIVTKQSLNQNDVILILLIIAFIYLSFFYKNTKDKK